MGSTPRVQGQGFVKKVQETKDLTKECASNPAEDKRLIRARQRAIGRELKRFYDGITEEPVPEDFLALLQQIDVQKTHDGEDDKTP